MAVSSIYLDASAAVTRIGDCDGARRNGEVASDIHAHAARRVARRVGIDASRGLNGHGSCVVGLADGHAAVGGNAFGACTAHVNGIGAARDGNILVGLETFHIGGAYSEVQRATLDDNLAVVLIGSSACGLGLHAVARGAADSEHASVHLEVLPRMYSVVSGGSDGDGTRGLLQLKIFVCTDGMFCI